MTVDETVILGVRSRVQVGVVALRFIGRTEAGRWTIVARRGTAGRSLGRVPLLVGAGPRRRVEVPRRLVRRLGGREVGARRRGTEVGVVGGQVGVRRAVARGRATGVFGPGVKVGVRGRVR